MSAPVLYSVIVPCSDVNAALAGLLATFRLLCAEPDVRAEMIVVNDGGPSLATGTLPSFRVLDCPVRAGRAAARNRGAEKASGDYLLFLDADCIPAHGALLAAHRRCLQKPTDISIGVVLSASSGFWGHFRGKRSTAACSTPRFEQLTTANCMFPSALFDRLGGFDEAFRHYGFEDRDLLLRAQASGARLLRCPDAVAMHADGPATALDYCRKMNEAARHTAPLFQRRHPDAYRDTRYATLDVRLHGRVIRWLAVHARRPALWLARVTCVVVRRECLPFAVRKFVLQSAGAMAFLVGSAGVELDER